MVEVKRRWEEVGWLVGLLVVKGMVWREDCGACAC